MKVYLFSEPLLITPHRSLIFDMTFAHKQIFDRGLVGESAAYLRSNSRIISSRGLEIGNPFARINLGSTFHD